MPQIHTEKVKGVKVITPLFASEGNKGMIRGEQYMLKIFLSQRVLKEYRI